MSKATTRLPGECYQDQNNLDAKIKFDNQHFNPKAVTKMNNRQISRNESQIKKRKIKNDSNCLTGVLGKLTERWTQKTVSPKKPFFEKLGAFCFVDENDKNKTSDNTMETFNGSTSHSQKSIPSLLSYQCIRFMSTGDKINYHIDVLELFVVFVQQISDDQDQDIWKQLKFALLKKYLMERKHMEKFMKKYPIQSPFKFSKAQIDTEEIVDYMKLDSGKIKLSYLVKQNLQIQAKLKKQWDWKIERSSRNRNLEQQCQQICKKLCEFILCMEVDQPICQKITNERISQALQLGFTIAELSGKQVVNLEDRETSIKEARLEEYISINKELFPKYLCR